MDKPISEGARALDAWLNAQPHGALVKLARDLGLKRTVVSMWRVRGVPADYVMHVQAITGVPWQRLRPDMVPIVAPAPAQQEAA